MEGLTLEPYTVLVYKYATDRNCFKTISWCEGQFLIFDKFLNFLFDSSKRLTHHSTPP